MPHLSLSSLLWLVLPWVTLLQDLLLLLGFSDLRDGLECDLVTQPLTWSRSKNFRLWKGKFKVMCFPFSCLGAVYVSSTSTDTELSSFHTGHTLISKKQHRDSSVECHYVVKQHNVPSLSVDFLVWHLPESGTWYKGQLLQFLRKWPTFYQPLFLFDH